MDAAMHADRHDHHQCHEESQSLTRTAITATAHCLIGCGIGEVLGLVIATALGWGTAASIALAVTLAFAFGYVFTLYPLLKSGMELKTAAAVAFVAAVPVNRWLIARGRGHAVVHAHHGHH